jgi:small subunit ribosomal protein S1
MSWVKKVAHPSEVVQKGQEVTCQVLNVDQERKRIALGLKQMDQDPWEGDIPARYRPGDIKRGKVTKLTNFGVFVELERGLEGLLHISELADHKVDSPEEVVHVGDEIEVKVLRVDPGERKIGLSRKRLDWGKEEGEGEGEGEPTGEETSASVRPTRELRGGTDTGGGQLINMPPAEEEGS